MSLLLTILSVLAVWAFLFILVIALLLIEKVLESVRAYLEKIAMGVRAIEKETSPLSAHAGNLAERLNQANQAVDAASRGLDQVKNDLGPAAAGLKLG